MRIGHYWQYKEKFKQATKSTDLAVRFVNQKDTGKYAEYLGHYGLSLALTGNRQGLVVLTKSLKLIQKTKNLRPFHKIVIHSGILMRTSIALNKFGKKQEAQELLIAAEELAKILATKYKMPMRLFQVQEIKNKKLKVF